MRISPVYSFQNYSQTQKNRTTSPQAISTPCKNKEVAFAGRFMNWLKELDKKYAPAPTLEELQKLAKEAQYHHVPLGNAIYRGDFKGVVSKKTIIEILQSELSKAKYTGTKQRYERLIQKVQKDY